jgi:hypothetical protein
MKNTHPQSRPGKLPINVSEHQKPRSYDVHVVDPISQSVTSARSQNSEEYPGTWTKRMISPPELFAWSKVLASCLNTSTPSTSNRQELMVLEVINVILPTVFRLQSITPATKMDGANEPDSDSGIYNPVSQRTTTSGRNAGGGEGGPGIESGRAPGEFPPLQILAFVGHGCEVDW